MVARRQSRLLKTFCVAGCFLVMLTVLASVPAWAHKVNLFAYAEGGVVYVESYFSDGSPVVQGSLRAMDAKGAQIFEGKTDQRGKAQFQAPPEKQDLTIELNASMGHRAVFTLKKTDW
ncbi:MAG: hypothetical protein WHS46_03820 [Desulfosoma sp.]